VADKKDARVKLPTSDRLDVRDHTPSGRSAKVSQLLVERAIDKELIRGTDEDEDLVKEKRKKRTSRSKDRSRRRRRSSSSSSGESDDSGSSFRAAHSSKNPARSHKRGLVGDRLAEGYTNMAHYLTRRGALSSQAAMPPIAATYWVTIAKPALKKDAPVTVDRELRTLAEAMDAIVTGDIAAAGDLLMARFCAVETSLNSGWNVAQHMELIPAHAVSSVSSVDQRAALRREAREMRDRDLLGKVAG
jgi:hypothetical protein